MSFFAAAPSGAGGPCCETNKGARDRPDDFRLAALGSATTLLGAIMPPIAILMADLAWLIFLRKEIRPWPNLNSPCAAPKRVIWRIGSRAEKSVRSPKSSSARLKPTKFARRGASRPRHSRANFHEFWRGHRSRNRHCRGAARPFGAGSLIFLDTNVISETLKKTPSEAVIAWLVRHDAELALPTVTIAEIAFGIQKILPDQRAAQLEQGLAHWRRRFADRIFGFTEEAALAYGEIMGAASRQGAGMSAPDGMIAAIARVNGGRLATRNLADFRTTGVELFSPWDF